MTTLPDLLTVTQAAELASVTERYIRADITAGRLSAHKLGNQWVIARADFDAWMANPRRGSRQRPSESEAVAIIKHLPNLDTSERSLIEDAYALTPSASGTITYSDKPVEDAIADFEQHIADWQICTNPDAFDTETVARAQAEIAHAKRMIEQLRKK